MRILYYKWNEFNYEDVTDALENLTHDVDVIEYRMKDYCIDPGCYAFFEEQCRNKAYDLIFSMNYFPLIAKFAFAEKIRYVSWVYDKPHWTMYSDSVFSPYNEIFTFDYKMFEEFRGYGVKNIYHLPLAVNTMRLKQMMKGQDALKDAACFQNEITFMGTLKSSAYSEFDAITGLPVYMKGYAQGLCQAQLKIYGYNMIEELVTEELAAEIGKYADFGLGDEFFVKDRQIIANMLCKKATMQERKNLTDAIIAEHMLTLYSGQEPDDQKNISYKGYADYYTQMPYVFNQSRINLNITMRSIDSGIPLRAFDILGAGGFLLSNYQPELDALFVNGQDMVLYESEEDLLCKIDYYLAHEEERMEIAANGQRKVEKEYTYEIQLAKLINVVNGE